ncbi:MAG: hypothetical protein L0Z70_11015 [Chloroflexi bacterium]|nr:hypothetical protein [Chloroflexota bacterium]
MAIALFTLPEDYWDAFTLEQNDSEILYNYLLETETPLTSKELVDILVKDRIRREKSALENQRTSGGLLYAPKEKYSPAQKLVFPAQAWKRGEVTAVRPGNNPDLGEFDVIQVAFEDGEKREYAANLNEHVLNQPLQIADDDANLDADAVKDAYEDLLVERLEAGLGENPDFVMIAGRWFPRALLVDIHIGHLNLAEAILDMANGGPLPTPALLEQIEIPANVNHKLLEFSMDLALQEDERFDEVGASGQVLWFLRRLEPAPVLEPPLYLRYPGLDYDRSLLTPGMLALENELDDELSPLGGKYQQLNEVSLRLIYPHWRAGTLPLSSRLRHLFPTAYEAPRIRFTLVDGDSGEKFPAWVVRNKRYVYGLREWFQRHALLPGSVVRIQRGAKQGEVIIHANTRRPNREWVRTVLVGSDGGVVYAMLKQNLQCTFDERMTIAVPDPEAIDPVWTQSGRERQSFEKVLANTVRELAKLNPQGHVHASELYAALNVVRRCPPGPILSALAANPAFVHVGDLHFRVNEAD